MIGINCQLIVCILVVLICLREHSSLDFVNFALNM